ncbi:cell wall / vacuolar inhibitor of fructosidase 2 [Carica papaya]|uniref:cell wall / vacuolar inhibitor of fructosidase 2 n=1 Tax=Carica papaya TaxID=3649 RepID=UPI000B8CAC68|nr:cell wall / vacuolar inhibitor of fructosidase 2 [Carica papaya]
MASPNHGLTFALIATFFVIFYPSPLHAVLTPHEMIQSVCRATNNNPFCLQTLKSDPQALLCKKQLDLVKEVMRLGKASAEKTQNEINSIRTKKDIEPSLMAALDVCSKSYRFMVESLDTELKPIEESDLMTLNYDIMVLFDEVRYCNTALTQAKAEVPEVSSGNESMKYYISMAAAATSKLK